MAAAEPNLSSVLFAQFASELRKNPQALAELRALLGVSQPADQLLTAQQVAERLSLSPRTVNDMAAEGRLEAVRVGRYWRFPADRLTVLPRPTAPDRVDRRRRRPARPDTPRSRRDRAVIDAIR